MSEITVYTTDHTGEEEVRLRMLDTEIVHPRGTRTFLELGERLDGELSDFVLDTLEQALGTLKTSQRGLARDVLYDFRARHEQPYQMSRDERRALQETFRDWNGTPTRQQRDLLSKYALTWQTGSRKGSISSTDEDYKPRLTVSSTPSAQSAGRNVAADLIRYITRRENSYRGGQA